MNIKFTNSKMCPCCNQLAEGIIKIEKYPLTEFYKKYGNERGELSEFLDQELCYYEQYDHFFLEKIIDIREIYTNYLTTTNSSKRAIDYLLNFKKFIDKKLDVGNLTCGINIGGNDSCFLGLFGKSKFDLVNIDANAEGVDGINIIRSFLEDEDLSAFSKDSKKIVSIQTIEDIAIPILSY